MYNIGIIGAGRLGTALARALSKTENKVAIINSRGAKSLSLQLQILLPGVEAIEVGEMIKWADILILAVPLRQFETLPLQGIKEKIVIDAMNYWSPVDGKLAEFDSYAASSSELVAAKLPTARIVKTLNSVAYNELEEHALPEGDIHRRAVALAGDHMGSKKVVSELINAIGFDPVDFGVLQQGVLFQPDTTLFNARMTANEMRASTPSL